jgi:hypothetical protein
MVIITDATVEQSYCEQYIEAAAEMFSTYLYPETVSHLVPYDVFNDRIV